MKKKKSLNWIELENKNMPGEVDVSIVMVAFLIEIY